MNAAQIEPNAPADGRGSIRAFGGSRKKLGMWLFLLSDSLTFGALLASYAYLRTTSEVWPRPFAFRPEILLAIVMTLCLLASSLTMVKAVSASSRDERTMMIRWMLATLASGAAFITLHLLEWNRLIAEGLRPFDVPAAWKAPGIAPAASPLFGATFFTLTGFHLLHVLGGVIYLGATALRRNTTRDDVEVCGLYWQFVDAVWLILFPALYLFSMK